MPPVTATSEEKNETVDTTPSKPAIGIIYPPPEVRSILPWVLNYSVKYWKRRLWRAHSALGVICEYWIITWCSCSTVFDHVEIWRTLFHGNNGNMACASIICRSFIEHMLHDITCVFTDCNSSVDGFMLEYQFDTTNWLMCSYVFIRTVGVYE